MFASLVCMYSVKMSICMLFLCIASSLLLSILFYGHIIPPHPPIHLCREEECEVGLEEEEEETPVTESDSDEKEGANESTSR